MKQYNNKKQLVKVICNCCGKEYAAQNNFVKADFLSIHKTWGYFSQKDGIRHEFDICEACFDKLNQNFLIPVTESEETEMFGSLED